MLEGIQSGAGYRRILTASRQEALGPEKEGVMKARITEQCMGDRNCNKLCPEVFAYDEDQLLSVVQFDVIPEKYEDVVRQAAQECGADAIIIEE
jgi:ferredoxin